ncbi:MAG: hypothetical protein COB85_01095, partial [Bacteroidetes bacterium]
MLVKKCNRSKFNGQSSILSKTALVIIDIALKILAILNNFQDHTPRISGLFGINGCVFLGISLKHS